MKILFLSYCYPPQPYPRSIQISHLVQFLRKDFFLDVITASIETIGDLSLLEFSFLDNVTYAKKSKITYYIQRSKGYRLKKAILPDLYYMWHFDLYKTACKKIQAEGADVVVTFGQPMSTHIAGLKLKKKFPHLKWIAHFSDPWIDNAFNEYNRWTRFLNTLYQDRVLQEADQLIFTSKETIDLVTSAYSRSIVLKAQYLPHCFNESLYPPIKKEQAVFVIRYLGNFYGNRQAKVLFEALKGIKDIQLKKNLFKIELIGASTISIEDNIKTYKLENFVFARPSVNYLESLRLMRESDLLLLIDAPIENSPFLPSKLIDYIGANKPIFGITPQGTSQKLIEEMGFLVAHPNNPEDIATKLLEMISGIQSGQYASIPEYIRNCYAVSVIGKQMKDLLEGVISQS